MGLEDRLDKITSPAAPVVAPIPATVPATSEQDSLDLEMRKLVDSGPLMVDRTTAFNMLNTRWSRFYTKDYGAVQACKWFNNTYNAEGGVPKIHFLKLWDLDKEQFAKMIDNTPTELTPQQKFQIEEMGRAAQRNFDATMRPRADLRTGD
jgi:hypothetical protein